MDNGRHPALLPPARHNGGPPLTPTEATQKLGPAIVDDILYGHDAVVAQWVMARLKCGPVEVPFIGLGILPPDADIDGAKEALAATAPIDLAAGVLFFNHQVGRDIEVSVATEDIRSAHPRVIRKILEYPFGNLNLPGITAFIDLNNDESISNAEKLGFVRSGERKHANIGMWCLERASCWVWNNVKP